MLDRLDRRRRHFLFGVIEHREGVFWHRAGLGVTPLALGVLVQRLTKEVGGAVDQPGEVARPEAVDGKPGARLDGDFERRAAEPIEQQTAKRFEDRKSTRL